MANANYWMDRAGCLLLRWSLGIVFAWFGALKLFDLCPLGEFIGRTVPFLPPGLFLFTLGCWEVAIGLCLVLRPWTRVGLWLLAFHLPGTFLPFVVIPEECFTVFPFGLTVAGQYIVKNLVLAGAALVVAGRYGCRRPAPPRAIPWSVPVATAKVRPVRRGVPTAKQLVAASAASAPKLHRKNEAATAVVERVGTGKKAKRAATL